jgi:phosphinothricin acetyltransferase
MEWFRQHTPEQNPIYVYEAAGQVDGWVSLSAYRPGRAGLKDTAEISYYVDDRNQGKGIGSRLVSHAVAEAARLGKRVLLAMILEGNTASISLLKKFGFEQWGFLPSVYQAEGVTRGHIYMGKVL